MTTAERAGSAAQVHDWLRRLLAETLAVPAQALSGDVPLSAYGIDSIVAGLVMTSVEDELGIALSADVLAGQPSLDELADRIAAAGAAVDTGAGREYGGREQRLAS